MAADDADLFEDPLTSLLAACDDALAKGDSAESLSPDGLAPELHSRLKEDLPFLKRLHQLRPGAKISDTSIGIAGDMPVLEPPLSAGKFGRFELRRELGRGGFGVVFLAYDPKLRREVALKVPRVEVLANPEVKARFQLEARAAAGLDHPNIVHVYETGEVGPIGYIASAYCPGITLASWLKTHPYPPPHQAAQLTATLADAVQHAHNRGVLHRDLKPGNILLQKSEKRNSKRNEQEKTEETEMTASVPSVSVPSVSSCSDTSNFGFSISDLEPKITDFGLAKVLEEDGFLSQAHTQTGAVLGTPAYMAPEQAIGRPGNITTAVDVYALGAILYELLTGRPPFQETSPLLTLDAVRSREPLPPGKIRPEVPRDLETICLKCLQKEPARRYGSAHALAEDLNRFLAGQSIQARVAGKSERIRRWCRRNPALAAVCGLAAGLVMILTLGSIVAAVSFAEKRNAAMKNLQRAEAAERALQEQLAWSLLKEARATRAGNQAGRRFDSLNRLDDALQIFRSLDLEADYQKELRDEIIAALAYPDLRTTNRWNVNPKKHVSAALDRSMERFAFLNDNGMIVFRRCDDNRDILCIPKPCPSGKKCSYMQFSPDGHYFIVKYEDQDSASGSEVQAWNVDCNDPGGRSVEPAQAVQALQVPVEVAHAAMDFSPDSRYLAIADWSGEIRIYDLTDGRETKRWVGGKPTFRLAFDPSGRALAVAGLKIVEIRDVETGTITASLPHSEWVKGVAWSPDGRQLACASALTVALWDISSQRLLRLYKGHEGDVVDIAFSHRGDLLASGGWDGMVRLWEVESGRQLANCRGNYQFCLHFSADDRFLGLAYEDDGRLGKWQIAPGKELRVLSYDPEKTFGLVGLDFSPDGQLLIVSNGKGLDLWDWSSLTKLATLPAGFCRWVSFCPDGSLLTTGSGGLWRWPLRKSSSVWTFGPPAILWNETPLERAWLSPDGRHLAASNRVSQAAVWELSKSTRPVWLNGQRGACFVAGSPDLRWIATGAFGGRGVRIWEPDTGKVVCDLPISGSANLAVTSDGKFLLTSTNADYSWWEVGTWKCCRTLPRSPRGDIPGYMAISPDNKVMAITYARNLVQLVNLTTGELLATLQSPSNHEVAWLAFHPDGTKLAVSCASHQVQIWDLAMIRQELARRDLDWDLPTYETHEATDKRPLPVVKVAAARVP